MLHNNLDDGYFTCIFLDLSKVFDVLNHAILLDKLCNYGIRGNEHKHLTCYLQNRKQFTVCNNIKSQINAIMGGVPQGSTLGPLLFYYMLMIYPYILNFMLIYLQMTL